VPALRRPLSRRLDARSGHVLLPHLPLSGAEL